MKQFGRAVAYSAAFASFNAEYKAALDTGEEPLDDATLRPWFIEQCEKLTVEMPSHANNRFSKAMVQLIKTETF